MHSSGRIARRSDGRPHPGPKPRMQESRAWIVVNSLNNLLYYPHDRGIREYVKSYPSKKLPRLLTRVNDLTSTSGAQ